MLYVWPPAEPPAWVSGRRRTSRRVPRLRRLAGDGPTAGRGAPPVPAQRPGPAVRTRRLRFVAPVRPVRRNPHVSAAGRGRRRRRSDRPAVLQAPHAGRARRLAARGEPARVGRPVARPPGDVRQEAATSRGKWTPATAARRACCPTPTSPAEGEALPLGQYAPRSTPRSSTPPRGMPPTSLDGLLYHESELAIEALRRHRRLHRSERACPPRPRLRAVPPARQNRLVLALRELGRRTRSAGRSSSTAWAGCATKPARTSPAAPAPSCGSPSCPGRRARSRRGLARVGSPTWAGTSPVPPSHARTSSKGTWTRRRQALRGGTSSR